MPIERQPRHPSPWPPAEGTPYKVKTGDDWGSIANAHGISARDLIFFNFGTHDSAEVNYCSRTRVGCTKPTYDRLNWMFTSDAQPGVIYLPVKSSRQPIIVPEHIAAKPYSPDFLTKAAAAFATGFATGLSSRLDSSVAKTVCNKILADKHGFYQGYLTGVLTGLLGGLTSLLELIVDLAKISYTVSMPNVLMAIAKEGYLLLTDDTHMALRQMQLKQAQETARAVAEIITDIQARPTVYIATSQSSGLVLGLELAAYVEAEAERQSAQELGKTYGNIVGRVLFEIIVFLVLAAVTGGSGEGARAGMAAGQAAKGSGRFARLFKKLMDVLEEMPAIKNLIKKVVPRRPGGKLIRPVGGRVNVGGGTETPDWTNLNPLRTQYGGPAKGIPNHVQGVMEEMDQIFEAGSVEEMMSSRLPFEAVKWDEATRAAANVMKPGGKVRMNVWCRDDQAMATLKAAFERAGFKNVKITGRGAGTMLEATR
jgi:hypothetical protein